LKKTSERSKHFFEKQGFIVASVEFWNSFAGNMIIDKNLHCPNCNVEVPVWKHAGIRQDLFKFADLIAFHPDRGEVLLIQSSAGSGHAEHKKKILDNTKAAAWVESVNRKIILISWSEKAPRDLDTGKVIKNKDGSKKKLVQTARVEEISYEDFC